MNKYAKRCYPGVASRVVERVFAVYEKTAKLCLLNRSVKLQSIRPIGAYRLAVKA